MAQRGSHADDDVGPWTDTEPSCIRDTGKHGVGINAPADQCGSVQGASGGKLRDDGDRDEYLDVPVCTGNWQWHLHGVRHDRIPALATQRRCGIRHFRLMPVFRPVVEQQ